MPYKNLTIKIYACGIPANWSNKQLSRFGSLRHCGKHSHKDALTNTLMDLEQNWYLNNTLIKSMALTDMLNMHEGNTRYGSAAIDQDLKRFQICF